MVSKLLIAFGVGILLITLCCVATLLSLRQLNAIARHLAVDPVPGSAAIARIAADFNEYRVIEVASPASGESRDGLLARKSTDLARDLKIYGDTITQDDDRRQFAELQGLWSRYADRPGPGAASTAPDEINALLMGMIDWNQQEGVRSLEKANAAARAASATVLSMLLDALLLAALALSFNRTVERPMQALAETAHAVALGNLHVRAKVEGPSEVATVAREFNEMLNARVRVEEALRTSEEKFSRRCSCRRPWGSP